MIAVDDDGPLAETVNEHLEKNGESVFGLALETDDIEMAKKELSASFNTDLEISDGKGVNNISNEERHWRNIFIPRKFSRGIFTLLIQHTKGNLPKHEISDESSISRMDHVVINSNDPDGLVDLYKEKYGIRLALDQFVEKWGGRMLFFRTNHTTSSLSSPDYELRIKDLEEAVNSMDSFRRQTNQSILKLKDELSKSISN